MVRYFRCAAEGQDFVNKVLPFGENLVPPMLLVRYYVKLCRVGFAVPLFDEHFDGP